MNKIKADLILKEATRMQEEVKNPKYIDMKKIRQDKIEYHRAHKDIKPDCLITGWITYIIIMIGGIIFYDYLTIAVFATFYFIYWRRDKIERANGRKYD